MNDFYRKIPIDSIDDPHMLFRPAMYNNFHFQLHLDDKSKDFKPLIMLNGVNITDLVKSKLKFENSPI